jgi:arylamine N-acetyltransferase
MQSSFRIENHKDSVQAFMRHYGIQPQSAEIQLLREILRHFSGFPYENISKIIKVNQFFRSEERIRKPEEVFEDHLQYGLGGTCFSLTWFLQSILMHHGFHCYPVIAHMRNRPNEHCALVVQMGHTAYLVDPGYLLHKPFKMDPDQPRLYHTEYTGVEMFFDRRMEQYHLYTFNRQEKKWRYCFRNHAVTDEAFKAYWLDSFYRRTMHGVCLTRVDNDQMIYLHNDYLQISTIQGKYKERIKAGLALRIKELFGIDPRWVEQALEKLPQNLALEKQWGLYTSQKEKENETG